MIGEIKEKITRYLDVHLKLLKLNFIGRTSSLLSYLMFAMIGIFMLFCIVLFSGLGLVELFIALDISKLGSFFIVVGIYVLLLIIFILCRRKVTRFFASSFILEMTKGDEEDKNEQ